MLLSEEDLAFTAVLGAPLTDLALQRPQHCPIEVLGTAAAVPPARSPPSGWEPNPASARLRSAIRRPQRIGARAPTASRLLGGQQPCRLNAARARNAHARLGRRHLLAVFTAKFFVLDHLKIRRHRATLSPSPSLSAAPRIERWNKCTTADLAYLQLHSNTCDLMLLSGCGRKHDRSNNRYLRLTSARRSSMAQTLHRPDRASRFCS